MTELIWDGKYVDGKRQSPVRVALPFQTIETVNESTADANFRQAIPCNRAAPEPFITIPFSLNALPSVHKCTG